MIYLLESCFEYYYVNNCKYVYLSSFLSYDAILPLFNVKQNLLIFVKIQDRNVFLFHSVLSIHMKVVWCHSGLLYTVEFADWYVGRP